MSCYGRVLVAVVTTMLVAAFLEAPLTAQRPDAPRIGISPPRVNFGGVDVGSSTMKRLAIRNRGTADLVVDAVSRCDRTGAEFGVSFAGSVTLEPKGRVDVEVAYSPTEAGADTGCLEVESNDSRNPVVEVPLRGRGVGDVETGEGPDVDIKPDSLDFGDVAIGGSRTRAVRLKNKGSAPLEGVMVGRCFETSEEFAWTPMEMFSVPPDRTVKVRVTYSPVDEGSDQGCLEIVGGDPGENTAVVTVTGSGGESIFDGVDLDIHSFKVRRKLRLGSTQVVTPRLWIKNAGEADEERTSMVIGVQDGVAVYEEEIQVSDRPGDQGKTPFRFPPFAPTAAGEVLWMAVVIDDDPDIDEALAVTMIEGEEIPSAGLDLDVARLRVTKVVSLSEPRPVRLVAWIRNGGSIDGERPVMLTGIQGGVEIYGEVLAASDQPGDRGATRYVFPSYTPDDVGDILWSLTIADEDPDEDRSSAVTRVLP